MLKTTSYLQHASILNSFKKNVHLNFNNQNTWDSQSARLNLVCLDWYWENKKIGYYGGCRVTLIAADLYCAKYTLFGRGFFVSSLWQERKRKLCQVVFVFLSSICECTLSNTNWFSDIVTVQHFGRMLMNGKHSPVAEISF